MKQLNKFTAWAIWEIEFRLAQACQNWLKRKARKLRNKEIKNEHTAASTNSSTATNR